MNVLFRQSGGFTGLVKGCQLDTEAMPSAQAQELERLVQDSRIPDPQTGSALSDKSRDLQQYEITVNKGNQRSTVTFDDGNIPESVRPLLKVLRQHARPQRAT